MYLFTIINLKTSCRATLVFTSARELLGTCCSASPIILTITLDRLTTLFCLANLQISTRFFEIYFMNLLRLSLTISLINSSRSMATSRGAFILFEGIDRCGKTTQSGLLHK